ncbi:MAG: ATP synthase F0 subunit B [Phycisphaerales bacterium]|nr:ATP synthase F0 subunit B [Phycisphaerales bacterium]
MVTLLAASPLDFDLVGFTVALTVFLLFSVVTAKFVWPKIAKGLDERYEKIRHEIESAEAASRKAVAAQAEFEKRLQDAREQSARMIEESREAAKKIAADLVAKNEAELAEMKSKALQDLESAKESAVRELNEHAIGLASVMASKILRREVSATDQARLVTESLAELGKSAKN